MKICLKAIRNALQEYFNRTKEQNSSNRLSGNPTIDNQRVSALATQLYHQQFTHFYDQEQKLQTLFVINKNRQDFHSSNCEIYTEQLPQKEYWLHVAQLHVDDKPKTVSCQQGYSIICLGPQLVCTKQSGYKIHSNNEPRSLLKNARDLCSTNPEDKEDSAQAYLEFERHEIEKQIAKDRIWPVRYYSQSTAMNVIAFICDRQDNQKKPWSGWGPQAEANVECNQLIDISYKCLGSNQQIARICCNRDSDCLVHYYLNKREMGIFCKREQISFGDFELLTKLATNQL